MIPLNSFQQMMLQWNSLSPYNAGHVICLSGIPKRHRWEEVIKLSIEKLGLGIPEFIQNNEYVYFKPTDSLIIETIEGDLDLHIQNELNKPFQKTDFPIRFFILRKSDFYYLGAIYNHWISDSYAMRVLFQQLVERYLGKTNLPSLRLQAPTFGDVFKKYVSTFIWLARIKELIKNLFYYQKAYRIKLTDPMNFESEFKRCYLPSGLIHELTRFAKINKVSVHDLFLAALGKALGDLTRGDRSTKKRKKLRLFSRNQLALGTIVDTRHHVGEELNQVFGQYLSNYTLLLKNPETISFHTLLKKIGNQTQKIKKSLAPIKNFASWDLALFTWNCITKPKTKARFFNKNAPIIAGISNVNLSNSWIGKSDPNFLLDYLRISPTGVLLPLVFTLTTLHDRLSLCITYRTAAFSNDQVNQLTEKFVRELKQTVLTQVEKHDFCRVD